MLNTNNGFCHCGCGQLTRIAERTQRKDNWIKGKPLKYIKDHTPPPPPRWGTDHPNWGNKNGLVGQNHPSWRGGTKFQNGYVQVLKPGHPRNVKGYVFEHILIAENVLGKYLPYKHPMHHFNEIRSDNRHSNLVICENKSYHQILHRRTTALKMTGNANSRRCIYCHNWDVPENLYINWGKKQTIAFHLSCRREDVRKRNERKKLAQH